MRHLDLQAHEKLLAGDPEACAYFREHLSTGCEACEAFLETQAAPELEGEVDRVLQALHPLDEEPLNEVGYARVRRRLVRPRWRLAAVAGSALAASLAVALFLPRAPPQSPGSEAGLKGAPAIELELSAVAREGGALFPVAPGTVVHEGAVLGFRYRASERGAALLLIKRGPQQASALGTFTLEPGVHELADSSGPVGLSLSGERGPVEVWLVAQPQGVAPTVEQARGLQSGRLEEPLSMAKVSFTVSGAGAFGP